MNRMRPPALLTKITSVSARVRDLFVERSVYDRRLSNLFAMTRNTNDFSDLCRRLGGEIEVERSPPTRKSFRFVRARERARRSWVGGREK